MPTDLDDVFASVAREADAIPLRPAAAARRRGRQRTRNGLIAAAAAVCVVAGGIGVLGSPERRADKTVAPTPSPSTGPLPSAGKPIEFGRTVDETMPVIVKDRVYAAWKVGTKISVVAADVRTSDVVWRVDGFEAGEDRNAWVNATEDAVLVSAGGSQTWVLDPADGSRIWNFTSDHLSEWVTHKHVLVQREARSGQVDAYQLRTGRKLWSIKPSGDRVDQMLGMRLDGDDPLASSFSDNRLVVVRRSGQVQVRDIASGKVLRTTTPVSPPAGGNTLIAYEGKLFDGGPGCCDSEQYRVVVTDLDTGASSKILTGELGHTIGSMDVCGSVRVCLVELESETVSWLRSIDVTQGGTAWSVPGPVGGSSLRADGTDLLVGDGRETRLLDGNGDEVFRVADREIDWLDGGRVLVLPPATGGEVMTVHRTYRTVITSQGTLPARTGPCAHTADRLVCPTPTSLRVYKLSG